MFYFQNALFASSILFCWIADVCSQQRIDARANSLHEDASHIKEHLLELNIADIDTSELTPSELDFHYFKLHDFDHNNKLDGLEMLQALMHSIHTPGIKQNAQDPSHIEVGPVDITPFTNIIDQVLKDDDLDNDGYLSYEEYQNRVKAAP